MTALLVRHWTKGALRQRGRWSALVPLVTWAIVAGGTALWARLLLASGTRDYMIAFWAEGGAFAPPFFEDPMWLFERAAALL